MRVPSTLYELPPIMFFRGVCYGHCDTSPIGIVYRALFKVLARVACERYRGAGTVIGLAGFSGRSTLSLLDLRTNATIEGWSDKGNDFTLKRFLTEQVT